MTVVLDASAAIEFIRKAEKADLIEAYLLHSDLIISSDLYKAECANAIWKMARAGMVNRDDLNTLMSKCNKLIYSFIDIGENCAESLFEAVKFNHPVYDMLYFTLARRTGAVMLTMDKRLTKLCKENGIDCPLLGTISNTKL